MFTIPTPSLFPTSSSFPVSRFVTEGESRARAMNCCVPEFALEDDSSIFPSSSSFVRRIPDSAREDIVELLWQHGPVFRRRSPLVSPHGDTSLLPSCTDTSVSGATSDSVATTTTAVAPADLFMEEDEMASWLNYPLGDDDFTGGFGGVGANYFPEKAQAGAAVVPPDRSCQLPKADRRAGVGGWAASARPPLPPETRGKVALFPASRASTVVDSSVTPGRAPLESMVSSGGGGERGLTSSSGVVGQGEAATKAAARPDDRKRKATEADDSDSHSEDADFESSDKKDDTRRSTTTKRRPRAAEVHNLSERRRRDRINEKMRALQQLIPRCNKSDKASMLDDAIEYLKSLQMQVQMMSMGCNMVPVMFPGIQQYMPPVGMAMPMGMSMGMGLGMGMDMNAGALNHPMMPFLQVMSSSHMVPTGAAPLNHGLPMQAFHAPAVAFPDQVKLQATGQAVPASNRACPPAPKAAQVTNHPDLCQQYIGFHQLQVHPQNQASTKQGTNKGTGMPEKSKTG